MSSSDDEKAKVYRQVTNAPEWTLVSRMRDTGFWPQGQSIPVEPPAALEERLKLENEARKLTETAIAGHVPDEAVEAERQRRILESRARREKLAKERADRKELRRKAHEIRLKTEIVHAGLGVSAKLEDRKSDDQKLLLRGYPVLHTSQDVAAALGITIGQLRFLTYHREVAPKVHYHRFSIPKKTGGVRAISAPKPALSKAQHWIFDHVLAKAEVTSVAHGFVLGRSVVSNAEGHVGKTVVVNLDLKDFFPTLGFARVRGLFLQLGYSGQVATLFALLCTEPPRVEAQLDDRKYWVAVGERALPQGACTSPTLTNLACRTLDRRLRRLAEVNGFHYTRYADDLTFSGDSQEHVGRILRSVRAILKEEGFVENEKKTQIMRSGRRQEVTGVVVNDKPGIGRDEVRTLRAILHNAARTGLEAQNREKHPNFAAYLQGRVAWACMVDPSRKPALLEALRKALARGG